MPLPVSNHTSSPFPIVTEPRPTSAASAMCRSKGASPCAPEPPLGRPSFRDHLSKAVRSLAGSERSVDRAIHRASHGQVLAPEQLLVFQATIYQHSLKLDLASKLVDKATGAVRQTLQSQS